MAKVYVEPRPKGRPEGSAIDDFAVEDRANHALKTTKTQDDAIAWARANGHWPIMVARVRNTDKGTPGHWREL